MKSKYHKNIISQHGVVVIVMVCIYSIIFTCLVFLRHDGLKSYMNDLGNMDQAIYNTTKGRLMSMTNCPDCDNGYNRLAGHANFILLAYVPIYYVLADPKVLLFTQTLLIALGALPLYLLGKRLLNKSGWLTLAAPFAYLISPMVHVVNLYDFHTIAVAMPLLMFAFYFMYIKRYGLFAVFAVLISLCNEDMSLIIFMMGVYMIFIQRERKKGFFVTVFSFIYFVGLIQFVMPWLGNGISMNPVTQRYSYLGDGVWNIAKNILTRPWIIGQSLLTFRKFFYVFIMLAPVLFLPVLAPIVILISLPSLLINLLSEYTSMQSPYLFYYSAPILPFIFLALVFSIKKLEKRVPKFVVHLLAVGVVVQSLLFSIGYGVLPVSRGIGLDDYVLSNHARRIDELKLLVPQDASLSVQNNLGAHFSQREKVFTFPLRAGESDYVLVDVNDPCIRLTSVCPNFIFLSQNKLDKYNQNVIGLLHSPNYGVNYYSKDGYILFKRRYPQDKNSEAEQMFNSNFEVINEKYLELGITQ